jgi:putative glutathione S-transferase
MGRLVDGVWTTDDALPTSSTGEFIKPATTFRSRVTADGSSGFPAVGGRYHLYASYACPWAHRLLILRNLKGLQDQISISDASYAVPGQGWCFSDDLPDPLGNQFLYQIYQKADPTFTGRVSVPALWDNEKQTIVSNESSEILEFLNEAYPGPDFFPEALRAEINEINAYVYDKINNGVYKCGFAKSQQAYDAAFDSLFEALDVIDQRLSTQRYLVGSSLTIADIRLFTTLIRFDVAYFGAFKCNLRTIDSYPSLSGYVRDIYQYPGVAETVTLQRYKEGYYKKPNVSPTIVPKGPRIDFSTEHGRQHLP